MVLVEGLDRGVAAWRSPVTRVTDLGAATPLPGLLSGGYTLVGDVEERSRLSAVPEISRFLGIVIGMFYKDHNPPHFHA